MSTTGKATPPLSWLERHPRWRFSVLVLYYVGIIVALLVIYGRGDFATPGFVYQEF